MRGTRSWGLAVAIALSLTSPASAQDRLYPDQALTPGDVLPVNAADVCVPGYARSVRNVPIGEKRDVYARYGVAYVRGEHEVDHLISLELGGSNSIRNLWPEAYDGEWGARVKDRIESRLHELVCNGDLSLPDAQRMIATDWIAAYRRFLGPVPSKARYYPRYRRYLR